jgi:CBS domain containing-hemolysin-like protein
MTLLSEYFASKLNSIVFALAFLLFITTINILADVVGTATAAASHAPFNAGAAKRVKGASHGLRLVQNADRVANICNDVIGDITTAVSGALGISIVVQIIRISPQSDQYILNVLLTAIISAVIVTGKAFGKKIALSNPDGIVFFVGRFLARVESLTGISFFSPRGIKNKPKVVK